MLRHTNVRIPPPRRPTQEAREAAATGGGIQTESGGSGETEYDHRDTKCPQTTGVNKKNRLFLVRFLYLPELSSCNSAWFIGLFSCIMCIVFP